MTTMKHSHGSASGPDREWTILSKEKGCNTEIPIRRGAEPTAGRRGRESEQYYVSGDEVNKWKNS